MAYRPNPHDQLVIDGVSYRVAEHPSAPGIAYGQEGRQGTVFKLVALTPDPSATLGRGAAALKAFKPRYRVPLLVSQSERLEVFAGLPGLEVCRRTVLTPRRHGDLLEAQPELVYAALMPWIEGPTWLEVLVEQRALAAEESLALAQALADLLAEMEQQGIAHCDLSGPNVLLPGRSSPPTPLPGAGEGVALVDVEQMYAPSLVRPPQVPSGSLGYAHRTAGEGLWSAEADRFAGAVLLGEMLGWCDERVRRAAWGESFFDPQEMQAECGRLERLGEALGECWGEGVAGLFRRAWLADTLSDCPTFGEWQMALRRARPSPPTPLPGAGEGPGVRAEAAVPALMALARRFEGQGKLDSALETYREAQAVAGPESGLGEELGLIVAGLEAALRSSLAAADAEAVSHHRPADGVPPHRPPVGGGIEGGADLAGLFDAGLEAARRGAWAEAKELLGEVVRRAPGYVRGGRRAEELLREVERRLREAAPGKKRRLSPWWLVAPVGGAVLLLALTCLGLTRLLLVTPTPTPTPVPPTQAPRSATATPVPPTPAAVANPLLLSLAPGVTLELVRVPAGEFTMGSTEYDDEKPVQTVRLGEYLIGKYEVTVAQFRAFVQATGYRTTAETAGGAYVYTGQGWEEVRGADWQHPRGPGSDTQDNQPVTQVSWDDAVAFCRWASEKTGRAVRLPTEAEWEKAARGTDGRRYPWGNEEPDDGRCNYGMNVGDTKPVGSYSPRGDSPYGGADMAGNVWEWTSSLYRSYPYKADDGREDSRDVAARVLRGGSFYGSAWIVRAAARDWDVPDYRYDNLGFRVCASPISL